MESAFDDKYDKDKGLGIYRMLYDIKDQEYMTPLRELKDYAYTDK